MKFRTWASALSIVVVTTVVAGCISVSLDPPPIAPSPQATTSGAVRAAPTAQLQPYYSQVLVWQPCGENQCAKLTVPIDYSNPAAGDVQLAVLRNPATGTASRGSLVINPGGPGASGIDYASYDSSVSPALHAVYDIVGFDPRGVGSSAAVRCLTGPQTDEFLAADATPDNAEEIRKQADLSQEFAAGCSADNPALVAAVDTASAARDMDVLRAALDEDTLNYLGFSYGTFLGATYAELFPTRVGRFVLDGAMDPALTNTELAKGQAEGFDAALQRYIADCVSRPNCPLGQDVTTANARLREFLASLDANPLPTKSDRKVTEALAMSGILFALYAPEAGWPSLSTAFQEAFAGDGTQLLRLVDAFYQRKADGTYQSNGLDAMYAVNCLDRPDRPGLAESEVFGREWAGVAPIFGEYLAYGNLPCAYWKVPAVGSPHAITAQGSPTILVVGTEFDPATPYRWSVALADQLANARLITWKGHDGHTAYNRGSACINHTIDRYLIDGEVPAQDVVCS